MSGAAGEEVLAGVGLRLGHAKRPGMTPGVLGVVTLLVVNLLAHFVPFERASRSLDDLARLVTLQALEGMSIGQFLLREILQSADRPFEAFVFLLELIAGESQVLAVTMVFLTSSVLMLAVYALMRELFEQEALALLCALGYVLLPAKLDLYHTLDYCNQNMVYSVYVVSLILFIRFVKTDRRRYLAGALGSYTAALWWYELGFFLPVVMGSYALLFKRDKTWGVGLFLLPAVAYVGWRTGAFGLIDRAVDARPVQFERVLPNLFVMFPQHYVGRYMARSVLYGLFRFPTLEAPWLALLIAADALGLYAFRTWLRRSSVPRIEWRMMTLAAVMSVALVFPATFYWGVLSRHTGLASIGVVMLGIAMVTRLPTQRVSVMTSLCVAGLLVCQGTAWSQVASGRMNHAIYEALRADRDRIVRSEDVLIDQYSFATRIPYTWVQDPNNQLDTYWGVAGLLGRGFPFLVHLAVGETKRVHVVRSPIEYRDDELAFQVYNGATYRLEQRTVPRAGAVVIDYQRVYGDTRRGRQEEPFGA